MKKKKGTIIFVILFFIGLSLLLYPCVANQWNNYRQSRLVSHYEKVMEEMKPEDFSREWKKAKAFSGTQKDAGYEEVLNIAGDGVMGYLSIPKIHVKLAIYHGTDETVLQKGVGHLEGTSLPVGGISSHSVLSAHRGLPSARLFTDIDQLEEGDKFYIHVLDEILAYQVDQILPMVEKDDYETLSEAFSVTSGRDYVTLLTCTPYGVNSHRLLVRGVRVPYMGEEDVEDSLSQSVIKSIQNHYMLYLILGLSATLLVILVMKLLFDRGRRCSDE